MRLLCRAGAPFLLFGILSLLLGAGSPSVANSCIANFDGPALALNPHFLGANTSFFTRPYDYTNPEVVRLTKELNLQTVRFPSGAKANLFNWKTGAFYSADELAKRLPGDKARSDKAADQSAVMAKYHPSFKTNDMVAFCRAVGAIPIWVANVLSGTPEEAAEWVAYNKKEANPNQLWELGNELYLRPYQSRFPTVQDYLKTARSYATAMKAADPSIQVAVDASSFRLVTQKNSKVDGEWVQNSGRSNWNETLAKEFFYDAIVVHDYFIINNEVIGKSEDEMHRYLMAHTPNYVPNLVNYYRGIFGKNVQIWLTEWNIFPYLERAFKTNPDNFPKHFAPRDYWMVRTVDHALFIADWYLELLRYPETFKITDVHVLCGEGYWGLFQLPAPETNNTDKAFLLNPPFYAVSWLGDALKNSDSYRFARIEDGPMFKGGLIYSNSTFPGVVAGAFFKGGAIKSVLLINKTMSVQRVSFKGMGHASPQGAASHCLTGLSPIEDWGKDKAAKNEDSWRPQTKITNSTISSTAVNLPPASLTYVIFK